MFFSDNSIPENTRNAVNSAVKLGRLPCSILLTGGSEELRQKCALELASSVLCPHTKENGNFSCGKCNTCMRVKAGLHPDVTVVLPEDGKKILSVKTVREKCLSRLATAPAEEENKVFFFPQSDGLQTVVQNALLKSVEEPPEDTMFIFGAFAGEGLLTTVISRLTEYPLGDHLTARKRVEENVLSTAHNIAMALCNEDEFGVMLSTVPMIKNRKMMASVSEQLILIIRDAMAQGSGAAVLSDNETAAYALSRSYKISSLLQIKEVLDKIISEAGFNANENLLISRFSSLTAAVLKERL